MKYEEELEIHFFDGKPYNSKKILDFFEFVLKERKDTVSFKIEYINAQIIDENIYEKKRITKISFLPLKEHYTEIFLILSGNFIEHITFTHTDFTESTFLCSISEWKIYYSYSFYVEDETNKIIFASIKDLYTNLIKIFDPLISNAWFETVWQDIDWLKKHKWLDGLFGYLRNEYTFEFVKIQQKIQLDKWYLFLKE